MVPVETTKQKVKQTVNPVVEENEELTDYDDTYVEQTRFEVKPSLWQRIKNSKLMRTLAYITRIRIKLDVPALPEGRGQDN